MASLNGRCITLLLATDAVLQIFCAPLVVDHHHTSHLGRLHRLPKLGAIMFFCRCRGRRVS